MGDDVAEVLAALRCREVHPAWSVTCRSCESWGGYVAEQIAPLLATARAQGAEQALRDATEMVIGCDHVTAMNWCGICDQWLAALTDRAHRLAADHTPPSEAS